MKESHPMKSVFASTVCGLYNRTKKLLTSHNKLHAKKGTSLLQCEECTYTTLRTDLLKVHKRIHIRPEENQAKLVCEECGGLFKSKPAHRKHVKIFHSKTEGSHACMECNKKFFQRHALVEHMNIHKETKAFSCEFCAQSFAMCSSLTKHSKRKHGELIGKYPEHACPHCNKKFWQPKELKTHVDREHNVK
jgi:KRAB domain-containing zinc finger protein